MQGEDAATLNTGIGWKGLQEDVERFKDNLEFTKLKNNQEGVDPDDVYSQIPYEKGFQFLWRIERQVCYNVSSNYINPFCCFIVRICSNVHPLNLQVGRPKFDEFLKKYIETFKFQSIDTQTVLDFMKATIPGIEKEVDLVMWTEGTGIPPDAYEPVSSLYTSILALANEFKLGKMPTDEETADWGGQEWELYLQNLPKSVEASQVLIFMINPSFFLENVMLQRLG